MTQFYSGGHFLSSCWTDSCVELWVSEVGTWTQGGSPSVTDPCSLLLEHYFPAFVMNGNDQFCVFHGRGYEGTRRVTSYCSERDMTVIFINLHSRRVRQPRRTRHTVTPEHAKIPPAAETHHTTHNLFCLRTPRCSFSLTLYPQS
jgi:hypothetical protein